jgi:hypothetical protein
MNKEAILIKFPYKKIMASLFELDSDQDTAFECKKSFNIRFVNKEDVAITLVKQNEFKESDSEEEMNQIIAAENKLKICTLKDLQDNLDRKKNKTCLSDLESDFIKIKYYSKIEANGAIAQTDLKMEEDLIIKNGSCFRIATIDSQNSAGYIYLYCSQDNSKFPIEILRKKSNENTMTTVLSVKANETQKTLDFTYLK